MALTFTAGTSVESTASVTSTTVTLPASLAAGDYTIIVVSLNATTGTITTPAGWTNILASTQATASTSDVHAIFYRKWVSGDTNPAVTTTSGRVAATPVKVSGADGTTFVNTAATVTQAAAAATTIIAPTITPSSTGLVCTFNGRSPTSGAFITPWTALSASMTSIASASGKATAATNAGHLIASEVVTSGSATGTRQANPAVSTTGGMGVSFALNVAGGTAYTANPADDEGLTDAVTPVQANVRAVADSVGLTGAVTPVQDMVRTATDTAGLTDTYVSGLDAVRAATDPAGLTDSASALQANVRAAADSQGLSDSAAPTQDMVRAASDSTGLTDATTAVQIIARALADSLGMTDSVSAVLTGGGTNYTPNPADPLGLTDAVGITQTQQLAPADSAGLTDATVTGLDAARAVSDTAGLTDSAAAVQAQNLAPVDAVGLTDAVARDLLAVRPAADSGGVTDAVTALQAMNRAVSDPAGLTDSANSVISAVRAAAEPLGMRDAVTAILSSAYRDLELRGVPLPTRWAVLALLPRWSAVAQALRFAQVALPVRLTGTALLSRWSVTLNPGDTMSTEILISAGAAQYVGGTVTDVNGANISAATYMMNLGSLTDPGPTWFTPDVSAQGATTASRVLKLLVSSTLPTGITPGTFYVWAKISDAPEIAPVRLQGPITVR